ncbi:MAG: OmpA/MotB family protein [Alphaproteobacteria bacterium]
MIRRSGSVPRAKRPIDTAFDLAGGDAEAGWTLAYADVVTLLLALFIVVVATAPSEEDESFTWLVAGFATSIGLTPAVSVGRDGRDLAAQLRTALAELPIGRDAGIVEGTDTVTVELPADVLFPPASDEIDPDAAEGLRAVALVLDDPNFVRWSVAIEGHTDDTPVTTQRFPSNWELSAARATNVLRLLEAFGVEAQRLKASAFADTRPKRPNRDGAGQPVPANQAQNRRVAIVVTR